MSPKASGIEPFEVIRREFKMNKATVIEIEQVISFLERSSTIREVEELVRVLGSVGTIGGSWVWLKYNSVREGILLIACGQWIALLRSTLLKSSCIDKGMPEGQSSFSHLISLLSWRLRDCKFERFPSSVGTLPVKLEKKRIIYNKFRCTYTNYQVYATKKKKSICNLPAFNTNLHLLSNVPLA